MAGLGLAVLVVAAPAPAYVLEAITTISAEEGEDRTRLDSAIQAAVDDVAANAVAFTPSSSAISSPYRHWRGRRATVLSRSIWVSS